MSYVHSLALVYIIWYSLLWKPENFELLKFYFFNTSEPIIICLEVNAKSIWCNSNHYFKYLSILIVISQNILGKCWYFLIVLSNFQF